ncbi:hypothetical protein [Neolewinella antarctica]|uniref:Uncharacterized protein n=1 Tax=Neolewinella antarctica TaxID=442734 RepID=A0ABX0X7E3_9BACT|nr:hypothetical protein [Neolewinella antarctica]NJC24928.1 hypothetical protein [Neolewinella antarctica]
MSNGVIICVRHLAFLLPAAVEAPVPIAIGIGVGAGEMRGSEQHAFPSSKKDGTEGNSGLSG